MRTIAKKVYAYAIAYAFATTLAGCGGGGATIGSGAPATNAPGSQNSASPVAPTPTAPGGSAAAGAFTGPAAGPAILYQAPATAPQLVNTGIWVAPPILVSGASSYRDGEYVYQGFLYDDHGATGTPDPNDVDEINATNLALPSGTYTYPTSKRYGGNAANIVEFRLKPTATATAFRITFNTMMDPTLVGFTIGLGGGTTSYAMPHGANVSEPAQLFVTVHGATADVVDAATGLVLPTGGATATDDLAHRQITVTLPYTTFDTRGQTALRVAVAAGLWNATAGTYLTPGPTSSAVAPGGATAPSPAAFFDVGFRHAEPSVGIGTLAGEGTLWRESAQAAALAKNDTSPFYDLVDMTKVAAGVDDDMPGAPQGVPQTGNMDRILSSHFEPFQGRNFTGCDGTTTVCQPELGSALQPYDVYIPKAPPAGGGYQMTLLLHSLSVNYNQFANSNNQSEFGERPVPSIVLTTEGRGPDNWYYDLAEADVFEAWADLAQRYPINPNGAAATGYSMGGYAMYKLGVRFPDLFGKLQEEVGGNSVGSAINQGGTTETIRMFESLRNIPILSWHAGQDELLPPTESVPAEQAESSDALNFEWDLFTPAEHLTFALNDQYSIAATFLSTSTVDPDPPHVSYALNPSMDSAQYGVVADHAYWVSGVKQRDMTQTYSTVDVFSSGFGVGDPPVSGTHVETGTLPAGNVPGCCTWTGFKNTYGTPPTIPVADKLTIVASNVSAFTVATARARVDCNAQLDVTTDGPLTVTLGGCSGTHTFGTNTETRTRTPRRTRSRM